MNEGKKGEKNVIILVELIMIYINYERLTCSIEKKKVNK